MVTGIESIASEVIKRKASEWLSENYGAFTLYTVRERALVTEDGLKPVNRRTLYTMLREGLTPKGSYMKAARVAGNTMAFHPHGNKSIEDSLAAMGQKFNMRVPLVDPNGSVGASTGDTPASARYWSARLTEAAHEILWELKEGAVEFGINYDETEEEPYLLPARWPNEIINGGSGIAVGYKSNLISHNPSEVMKALVKLLRNPEMTVDDLLRIMPGPDFPTGGEVISSSGIRDYYETGKGSLNVRARYTVEDMSQGRSRIIFNELPYGVSIASVIEKINDHKKNGKMKEISEARDSSGKKTGTQLVVEAKRGTNHLSVLADLFKMTPLETRISVLSNVLIDNLPKSVSTLDLLKNFLEFRRECNVNKAEFRIKKIDGRTHQLDAILKALVDIDKAIAIIRSSDSPDEAKNQLCAEFDLDDEQADYILSMQLRRLTRADSVALEKERETIAEEKKNLLERLEDVDLMDDHIESELNHTAKIIASERRTVINNKTDEEIKEENKQLNQVARNADKNLPCYVTVFANGKAFYTVDKFEYDPEVKSLKYGPVLEQLKVKTKDQIVLVDSEGVGHRIPVSYLSPTDPQPLESALSDEVEVVGLAKAVPNKTDVGLAMATRNGSIKIAKGDFPNKPEFPVFSLDEDDKVIGSRWISGSLRNRNFVLVSSDSNSIVFEASDVRVSGSRAGGSRGMKTKDGHEVVFFGCVNADDENVLTTVTKDSIKMTHLDEIPPKNKGGMGVSVHSFRKGETKLDQAYAGSETIICLDDDTFDSYETVSPPPLTKRSTSGMKMALPLVVGSRLTN